MNKSNHNPIWNPFQLKVSLMRQQNKRFLSVFGVRNMTIDLCKYLAGQGSSNFLNWISDELKEHSNVVHPCPFSVRFNYLFYYCTCQFPLIFTNFRAVHSLRAIT